MLEKSLKFKSIKDGVKLFKRLKELLVLNAENEKLEEVERQNLINQIHWEAYLEMTNLMLQSWNTNAEENQYKEANTIFEEYQASNIPKENSDALI